MDLRHSTVTGLLASAAMGAWAILASSWRAVLADSADIYRPEAHYMRGPGPKWREKHARGGNTAR